ncbi:MAG: DUF6077 domain-containing protein [Bacteroidales bacterium]|nr:DUF6077 domain-containing protein [Bacteroidales bacterium]MCM1416562.1 DUF6077 domain-containing protein [bacterium]MCM1423098.1 DUF6077 domain-containing protein [bacterium]
MTAIVSLLFWLVAVPFAIGLIPANFIPPVRRNPGFVLLAGYFVMWALFALAAIPAVLWVEYDNFKVASAVFAGLALSGAAVGICLLYRNGKAGEPGLVFGRRKEERLWQKNDTHVIKGAGIRGLLKSFLRAEYIEWLAFFFLLGFQLYKAAAFASFDGDDAYYVVESLLAQEADVMYRILPLTGGSTGLDVRHALAVFPMWVAFVAVRSGIHATIVSHVVMPFVLIPLTYLLYYEIGCRLFGRVSAGGERSGGAEDARETSGSVLCRENLPVFMILLALFQIFGNVSIYTTETFFLTRTWQGKAAAGALVIPAVLWLFLLLDGGETERGQKKGLWLLFVCVQMTAGICSSIAVFLVSILTAVTAFVLACMRRDLRLLLKFGAACIPNVIYMAIYVVIGYSYLL